MYALCSKVSAKLFINIFKNFGKRIKNKELYKSSRENVLNNLKEWADRIGDKPFHGGEQPDEADFEVIINKDLSLTTYSLLC